MNLQHVILINNQLHEINSANGARLLLNAGKRFAIADMHHKVMIHKHVITGRFQGVKIK